MLKTTLVICVGLFLFGCGAPAPRKAVEEKKTGIKESVEVRNLLKEYEAYLSSLDSTSEKSVSLATEKYESLFSRSDQKVCDSAFIAFHKLYENVEGALNTTVYTGDEDVPCATYDEEGNELPKDKRLVALEKRMKKHGFRVECWEGYPCIVGERAYIASHFYRYVSPEMKTFLEGLRKERDQLLGMDAGISLSEEEYVERLIRWENFNKKNPGFILAKRAQGIQRYLFTYFLIGMDNTPAINYLTDDNGAEKMELDTYFMKAYDYLNKKYPNS